MKTVSQFSNRLKHIKADTREEAFEIAYSFGQWVRGALFKVPSAIAWCERNDIAVKAAQAEDDTSLGGALVPVGLDRSIIDIRERYGIFRQSAHLVRMESDRTMRPRRSGSGAPTVYWASESDSVTNANLAWEVISFEARKLMAQSLMTNELSEDAIVSMADEFAFQVGYSFSLREDQCGFIGDGTSTYRGITGIVTALTRLDSTIANIAGLQVATGTGYGSNYNSMVLADFEGALSLLPAVADNPNTCWYMHRTFFYSVALRLAAAVGNAPERDSEGRPLFLGIPVKFTQVLPKTSAVNQVVALVGDLSLATSFGDRRAIKLLVNPYSLLAQDVTTLTASERFDIVVHEVGNASSSAASRVPGAVVGLITGAS